MTAYVIVDIEVKDSDGYKEYVKVAPATVAQFGGRYIARGGANETLEESGAPTGWSSWNSHPSNRPKPG